MKRIAIVIIAALAALSLFAACGDDRPLPANDRELLAYRSEGEYTVWSFNIRLKTAFEYGTRWDERKADVAEYLDAAQTYCAFKRSQRRNTTISQRR